MRARVYACCARHSNVPFADGPPAHPRHQHVPASPPHPFVLPHAAHCCRPLPTTVHRLWCVLLCASVCVLTVCAAAMVVRRKACGACTRGLCCPCWVLCPTCPAPWRRTTRLEWVSSSAVGAEGLTFSSHHSLVSAPLGFIQIQFCVNRGKCDPAVVGCGGVQWGA